MAAGESTAQAGGRGGVYLALLQLVFTLGWTVYAIYLPKLAAQVGIARSHVILILMLDQAIFTVMDTAMGMYADRIGAMFGRLGIFIGAAAAISCAAFVLLPFVAATGPAAQPLFLGVIVVWAVTSSALRAPPLTLFGKYAARPALPLLSALAMLGYGVAGAVSPYLGVVLRNVDARIPFVVSSAVLLLAALALARAGRVQAVAPDRTAYRPAPALGRAALIFIVAMVVLALGYQVHFSLNSAVYFLRFAKPADLDWLMPVFWIGFNVALFPASYAARLRGGLSVMGVAGLVGAMAMLWAEYAGDLNTLVALQFVAGAAWGCMLMCAMSTALVMGHTGAEGKVVGLVFSALALATFARMAAVAGGLQKMPEYIPLLHWAPVACWLAAGAALAALAASRLRHVIGSNPSAA